MIKYTEEFIAETTADRDAQKNILAQPFEKQNELEQKRARFNEVMELLAPKSEEQLGKMDDDTVQEQSRDYLENNADTEECFNEVINTAITNGKNFNLSIRNYSLQEATVYAIRAYRTITNEGRVDTMQRNLDSACKKIFSVYATIKVKPRFANEYGIKNEEEFVAELANPYFVEKLKNTYASPWHKILEAICELLGINKRFSMYGKLKSAVDDILSAPDYALAKDFNKYIDLKGNNNAYYLEDTEYQEHQRTRADSIKSSSLVRR